MSLKWKLLVLSCVSSSVFAQELDPIIFTSKQENPQSKMTSSSVVLEKEEIENQGNMRAVDLLEKIPGVEVAQTGIVGGQAGIFIRGAESRHTVIMIDGVKVYDPTQVARSFNLATLNTLDIEKIEVVKGAQSVLYGSDAIGGVINIITKKGEGKNRLKAGLGIVKEISAGHTFDLDKGLIYVNGYYQDSEFASDAEDKNIEDLKVNKGLTATGNFQFENLISETTFKLTNDFSAADGVDTNGLPTDNRNAYSKSNHMFLKQGFKYDLNRFQKVFLDVSYNDFVRTDNSSSTSSPDNTVYKSQGRVMTVEGRFFQDLRDGANFVAGFSRQSETFEDDFTSETEVVMNEAFGNYTKELGSYIVEGGARLANNSDFGSHLVYTAGARYNLDKNHSFKTSYKTGFQAPSTYQQAGVATISNTLTQVGNENVAPEKSQNFEMGYEYKEKGIQAGVDFFQNSIEDFITYDTSVNKYGNENELQITGIDTYFNWQFKQHTIGSSLALYDYDLSTGREVARRPKESIRAQYKFRLDDQHTFGGDIRYQGERFDYPGGTETNLDAYQVIDLNYKFVTGDLTLMAYVMNLLDTEYEVAAGFNTLGRSVQLNLEYIY